MSTVNISRADVVVIGGGIFGCCAAYHLRQAGVGTVVLLERAPELATETSWAGAGFVALWSACADDATLELELEHYALQFYQELAAKQPIGLKRIGMVWIAQTAAGSAIQVRQYEAARRHVRADDVQLLTLEQVGKLVPIVAQAQVASGLHWRPSVRPSSRPAGRAASPLGALDWAALIKEHRFRQPRSLSTSKVRW